MADNDNIADTSSSDAQVTATTTEPAPAASPSDASPADNNSKTNHDATPNNFKVPEEYKNSAWAQKYKSEADLWKAHANAQELIGKKGVVIPDFEKATPEELESFYSKMRPKDNNYGIEGKDEQEKEFFTKLYSASGLSKAQADVISKGLETYTNQQKEVLYNIDSLNKSLAEAFGDKYKEVTAKVSGFITSNLGKETTDKILEEFPNELLLPFYKIMGKIMDEYGIKETGLKTGDKAGSATQTPAERTEIMKKIAELSRRPHTLEEKNALIAQLKY
jgi:hypothetical protein